MPAVSKLALCAGVACLAKGDDRFEFVPQKHACGVCKEIQGGMPCELYGACHILNRSSTSGSCKSFCPPDKEVELAQETSTLDVRVTKGFGTRAYSQVRVSVISNSIFPRSSAHFDYSAKFKYKWTDNYLQSSLVTATPGEVTKIDLGEQAISVKIPKQGAGVAGVLIADPCMDMGSIGLIGCSFGEKFQTNKRTVELINTFVPDDNTDFWGLYGDNFYDRTGEISQNVFSRITQSAKSKIFTSVPGNHDYWVLGSSIVSSTEDQCANGHMQFYAQDAKSAERIPAGSSSPPFNLSIDPDEGHEPLGCNKAEFSNFFWYNQIGNVGLVGQSGAYPYAQQKHFMTEACAWLGAQPGVEVGLLFGHWDDAGLGAVAEMAMPKWYTEMTALPGCKELDERGMLKFVMGHTHCNDPHPHGKTGSGFRVAGFGMEGCGNYGIPIVDTTEDRVRFWYFDTSDDVKYNTTIHCVQNKGWRGCANLATSWLDQPINRSVAEQIVV